MAGTLTLGELFKVEHDVAGESRAQDGKWTGGGGKWTSNGGDVGHAGHHIDVSHLVGKNTPEHIFRYFDKDKFDADPRSRLVNVKDLVSTKDERDDPRVLSGEKADPRATAAKFMAQSARGEAPTRAPIAVTPHEDGSGRLRVLDGNATTQVAQMAGWEHMPATVLGADEARVFEEHERQKDAAKKAAREAAKALGKMTLAQLFDVDDLLKTVHDVASEARDNSGEWTAGGSGGSGGHDPATARTAEAPDEPLGRNDVPLRFDRMLKPQDHDEAESMFKRVSDGPVQRAKAIWEKAFPGAAVHARAKGIKNMLVKLAKDRMKEPDKEHTIGGLSDAIGTRVEMPDIPSIHAALKRLHDMDARGEIHITREKNFIDNPNAGYRAYHMNFDQDGAHGELQIRTPLQSKWAEAIHDTMYKAENQPPDMQARIAQNIDELKAYADQLSKRYYDLDSHAAQVTPMPPCTDAIQSTIGCQ